jgi:alanine-alpha-ketoisovalerate/valine-pyruvate aminotransferase
MKNLKITKVTDNSPYGLYVWLLPDGNIFRDDENNVLNIPSLKGDQEKIDTIAKAAASYGQSEGKAVFINGVGRLTDEEYEQELERRNNGLITYGDTGAWRDAARARRLLGN